MLPLLIILFLGMIVWAFALYAQYRHARAEARQVYDARLERREFAASESFEPFERAFLRTSDVRIGIYRWIASMAAIFAFPIAIMVLSFLWARGYYLMGRPAWMTEGELVHSFGLALGGMGMLVLVAWIFVRHYYSHRPGTFEEEWEIEKNQNIEQAKGEAA